MTQEQTSDDILNDPVVVEAALDMAVNALEGGVIAGATLMLAHLCAESPDPEEQLEGVLAELRGNAREILAALLSEEDDELIEDEPVGAVQ